MATTTYCNRADVDAILSTVGVTAFADDDEDGSLDATELGYVTRAIERAANRMNAFLEMRYELSDLSGNDWCRDANAALAAFLLGGRRNNPVSPVLSTENTQFLDDLKEIRDNNMTVPGAFDSNDALPSVTNFRPERSRGQAPVRVIREESTRSDPPAGSDIKRRFSREHPSQERGWP